MVLALLSNPASRRRRIWVIRSAHPVEVLALTTLRGVHQRAGRVLGGQMVRPHLGVGRQSGIPGQSGGADGGASRVLRRQRVGLVGR